MKKLFSSPPSHWASQLILFCTIFFATGCANLAAVRDFAKTSAATADYNQVVSDYTSSPERRKVFQDAAKWPELTTEKADREKQAKSLQTVQKVLTEYLTALGNMAADELPSVDKEIEGLATSVTEAQLPGMNANAIKSASQIAKVLTNAVLGKWREGKVKQLVKSTDPDLQKVIAGMNQAVAVFEENLKIDDTSVNSFFRLTEATYSDENQKRFVRLAQAEYLKGQQGRKHLDAYKAALKNIGEGHSYLAANIDKLKQDDVRKRLNQYTKDLQALYKAFQELKS